MNELLNIVKDVASCNKKDYREKVLRLEESMLSLPQADLPHISRIHGGMYCREMTIPKGTLLTGRIYKFDHFEVMVSGDITIPMDNGEVKRLKGYNFIEAFSGKKRIGYAHEDTIWMTFHPFWGKDADELQEYITSETFEDLAMFHTVINRGDYETFVNESQFTKEEIRNISEFTEDTIDLPVEYSHLYVADSDIEGVGFYSKIKLLKGDVICPSRIDGKTTKAERYINHALLPNAKMILQNGEWLLMANRDIDEHEEITTSYRETFTAKAEAGEL